MKAFSNVRELACSSQWPRRLEAVEMLALMIAHEGSDSARAEIRDLLIALADDPKWEVRRSVMEAARIAPRDIFEPIIGKGLNDANQYVVRAAVRARKQRSQSGEGSGTPMPVPVITTALARLLAETGNSPETAALGLALIKEAQAVAVVEFAHELRNLVSPLMAAVSALENSMGKEELKRHRGVLERLRDHAARVDDFGQSMKFLAEGKQLSFAWVDVNQVVTRACYDVKDLAGKHGVTLRTRLEAKTQVRVVQERLTRALNNIIRNAIEAAAESTKVERVVEVSSEFLPADNEVHVTVRDSGGGLDVGQITEVFKPLVSGYSKQQRDHLGMGLAVARRVIEDEHRGRITVQSDNKTYCEFQVSLPINADRD